MSIAPVASAPPSTAQTAQAAATPFKRDRDGDYDNNKVETQQSESAESAKGGQLLNIKA
jgi:hypothetical protein